MIINLNDYQFHFNQTVKQYLKKMFIQYDEHKPYLFTQTYSMNHGLYKSSRNRSIFRTWDKFYLHLCSYLINNYSRKYHLLPKMIACIDFPYTRNHSHQAYRDGHLPHIHAIMFLHPDTIEKFELLRESNFRELLVHEQFSDIRDTDVRPIRETLDDLENVTSYCTKFIRSYSALQDPLIADECHFQIYPKPQAEMKRYNHLTTSPFKDVPTARTMKSARP